LRKREWKFGGGFSSADGIRLNGRDQGDTETGILSSR